MNHLAWWIWPLLEGQVDVLVVARHTRGHRALVQGPGSNTLQNSAGHSKQLHCTTQDRFILQQN